MKRVLLLILAIVMCLSLCACGVGGESNETTAEEEKTTIKTVGESPDDNKSRFVGLYRKAKGALDRFSSGVLADNGGYIYLNCYKYINLNQDGTGNIYYELATDETKVSEEKIKAVLDEQKRNVTWDTEDGYLIIYFSEKSVSTYEKKGAHFINIINDSDILAKLPDTINS